MVHEKVGILAYITKNEGIGGRIKDRAEEFRVTEIAKLNLHDDGEYTILKVTKKNWDTMNLARVISNMLGISQKRVYYAGTKDKRAITTQYFSIRDLNDKQIEKLKNLELKDVDIEILGKSRKAIQLGDLIGNKFSVKITDVEFEDKISEKIEKVENELMLKGTPNFFGLQRFGSIRYITHEVGKHILLGEFEEAFWTYVAKPFKGENEDVRRIREELWESRDVKFGLKELPKYLRYERTLLQKLREGKDEEKALLSLPKNLKMMFVHAYQSYLFNLLLSERIMEFGNLKDVEYDDVVSFVFFSDTNGRYYSFKDDFSIVSNSTKKRIKFLIEKRRAVLTLPLPGYETVVKGWCGDKLRDILERECVSLKNFKSKYKEFSSKGSFRAADMLIEWTNLRYCIEDGIIFEFYLPKGCYATVFLREFVKDDLATP